MELVSENSDEKLRQERARRDFNLALVRLTANLMRVTRGAGASYEVGRQAVALVRALDDHWQAFGHYPSSYDYQSALSRNEPRDPEYGYGQWRRDALAQIVSGSLQVSASRLLDQPLQVAAGEREMDNGLRYYLEWLEEGRRERRARDLEQRRREKAAASKKPRAKPGPKPRPL